MISLVQPQLIFPMKPSRTASRSGSVTSAIILPLLSALFLTVIMEGGLRLYYGDHAKPFGGYGYAHFSADLKLGRFMHLISREIEPDFIFIGHSMADRAFYPSAFKQGFASRTGKIPSCFNLAFHGLTRHRIKEIIQVINRISPSSRIIWGCGFFDFGKYVQLEKYKPLHENNWFRYRLGEWNLEGWLTHHSVLLRRFSLLRMRMEFPASFRIHRRYAGFQRDNGFFLIPEKKIPRSGGGFSNNILRKKARQAGQFREPESYRSLLSRIVPADFRGNTRIVLLPTHHVLTRIYKDAGYPPKRITGEIAKACDDLGIPVIEPPPVEIFFPRSWKNPDHLSPSGAREYSLWLGERLGEEFRKGRIRLKRLPTHEPVLH